MTEAIPYPRILEYCDLVIQAEMQKREKEEKIWDALLQPPPEQWREQDD